MSIVLDPVVAAVMMAGLAPFAGVFGAVLGWFAAAWLVAPPTPASRRNPPPLRDGHGTSRTRLSEWNPGPRARSSTGAVLVSACALGAMLGVAIVRLSILSSHGSGQ
jgi:hypothetical protein